MNPVRWASSLLKPNLKNAFSGKANLLLLDTISQKRQQQAAEALNKFPLAKEILTEEIKSMKPSNFVSRENAWKHVAQSNNQRGIAGADLRKANYENQDLSALNLSGADLQEVNFINARLQNTNLQNANLRQANLENASLQNATIRGANLQQAKLRSASLQNADLQHTNLR